MATAIWSGLVTLVLTVLGGYVTVHPPTTPRRKHLVVAMFVLLGLAGFYFAVQQATETAAQNQELIDSQKELVTTFKAILTDKENRELIGFTGVEVLEDKIVDGSKGYLRIKIRTDYLNSSFATPVTLKNSTAAYQPVTIVCDNDPKRGPGIFAILPVRQARTVFYFSDFLTFENLGKQIYVEDFVFELFYNDFSFYFVTTSGAIRFEPLRADGVHLLGPFKIGPNLITRPFDNKSYEVAQKMFPKLASFFGRDFAKDFPDLYAMK